ncbi:MAG: NADH-quinone oxidoreductase subunit A [Nitrospira sp.]|nr:NADH-quinone oxidoreductase subunit A [Nitrospira sp.]MBX3332897.1 NADH-quinone oxidoreductase subunit A [Nitrospira sp.]MDR4465526.1 NADH-quinone oxidoreductase subunit A [Nitrospira sp.]
MEGETPESLQSLFWYATAVFVVIGTTLLVSYLVGERHESPATSDPYESGIVPTGSNRFRVPVQFYLVAMLFVIFDLEAVYVFAWALVVREAGWPAFWEMTIFIGVLLIALIYVWRVGALDWRKNAP